LQKDFTHALASYVKAVDIEPEESTFVNAVSYCMVMFVCIYYSGVNILIYLT